MRILTIGRKGTDIVLEDAEKQISRLHAELTVTDGGRYYLVDCGSSNGTSVKRQGAWKPLKQDYVTEDEEIRFGGYYSLPLRELLKKKP
jgi:pSer/pThr/pTyr-binding forkhead associated (FHA) protein